ncbi:MAG: hypothetical protein ABJ308_06960 [Halieaceae bacterium]
MKGGIGKMENLVSFIAALVLLLLPPLLILFHPHFRQHKPEQGKGMSVRSLAIILPSMIALVYLAASAFASFTTQAFQVIIGPLYFPWLFLSWLLFAVHAINTKQQTPLPTGVEIKLKVPQAAWIGLVTCWLLAILAMFFLLPQSLNLSSLLILGVTAALVAKGPWMVGRSSLMAPEDLDDAGRQGFEKLRSLHSWLIFTAIGLIAFGNLATAAVMTITTSHTRDVGPLPAFTHLFIVVLSIYALIAAGFFLAEWRVKHSANLRPM